MYEKESCAWSAVVETIKNFLGNRKAVNYKGIAAKLLITLQDMGANMSIKHHFLCYTVILTTSLKILVI